VLVVVSDQSATENGLLKEELSKLNSTFSEFRAESREEQATSAQRIADLEGQLAAMNATNTGKLNIYIFRRPCRVFIAVYNGANNRPVSICRGIQTGGEEKVINSYDIINSSPV